LRDAAAAAAETKKQPGTWVIMNTRSSIDPFLTYSDRRDLREKAWRMFVNRGDNGDEHDNNAIITEILQLRAERAKLLGYPTHAHWRLENSMAKTPERAMELMEAVWKPAVARVHEEVADMQALADKEGAKIKIEPWDYRYYMEKVRKAKYDLDQNEVKPYLQLEKLREGIFWVAGELFNFNFTPVTNVPVAHPGHSRLGSDRQDDKETHRSLVLRSVCARRQTLRRVDERLSHAGTRQRRDHDDRFQQRKLRERQTGRAGADLVGRRDDDVP
jgi:peptidyl-dipeptidase Dcp